VFVKNTREYRDVQVLLQPTTILTALEKEKTCLCTNLLMKNTDFQIKIFVSRS